MIITQSVNDSLVREFEATENLGGQFTAVELTANGLSIAGVSSIPLGILLEEPTDESVTVQIGGGGYWLAGESVAAGDFLSAGASGLAVKSTSGKFIFAQAMKCAAANEAAQVQIVRAGIKA